MRKHRVARMTDTTTNSSIRSLHTSASWKLQNEGTGLIKSNHTNTCHPVRATAAAAAAAAAVDAPSQLKPQNELIAVVDHHQQDQHTTTSHCHRLPLREMYGMVGYQYWGTVFLFIASLAACCSV
eukprot:scaffold51947_cov69-Attheya_sp.AAC.2